MVTDLAKRFMISLPTIYTVLKKARLKLFVLLTSKNERYHKTYLGKMLYVDTKRLPLLKNEIKQQTRKYLFVGIADFSRELYTGIYHDKSQFSSAQFLQNDVLAQCPYTIECIYSDNGREYQGTSEHLFVKTCHNYRIGRKFAKSVYPQRMGKLKD